MKNHIMLDLETLGTKTSSVFLSIGAVQFDIETGEIGKTFYVTIDMQSALDAGLTVDADTIRFWLDQDSISRRKMFNGVLPLKEALEMFAYWMPKVKDVFEPEELEIVYVWGNSMTFDCGILGNGFDALGMKRPWDYYYERDYRTMIGDRKHLCDGIEFEGVQHDPIDDAKHQIKKLVKVWKAINNNSLSVYQDSQFVEDYESAIHLLDRIGNSPNIPLGLQKDIKHFLDGTKPITKNGEKENNGA